MNEGWGRWYLITQSLELQVITTATVDKKEKSQCSSREALFKGVPFLELGLICLRAMKLELLSALLQVGFVKKERLQSRHY